MFYKTLKRLLSFSLLAGICAVEPHDCKADCFSSDDLRRLSDIRSPVISPDGKFAAYVLRVFPEPLEGQKTKQDDIWLVSLDGEREPVQFIFTGKREYFPRWSPDGDRLAFLSDREGKEAQLFTIRVDEGEAERISSLDGEVLSFCWSPDGESIAAVVRKPAKSKDERGREEGCDEKEIDSEDVNCGVWICNSRTGEAVSITGDKVHVLSVNWSPDGKDLAMIVSDSPSSNSVYYHSRLEILDITTTQRKVLSYNASGYAEWSSDGKRILFTIKQKHRHITVSVESIAVINADGSGLRVLGRNYLGTLVLPRWHPDGKRVVAMDMAGVRGSLVYLSIENDNIDFITKLNIPYYSRPFFDISEDGSRIVTLKSNTILPPQLWLIEEKWFGDSRRLTEHNKWLSRRNLPEAEVVEWTSRDGTKVEGVLFLPPGYSGEKRYPAILNIHGGPMWAWWLGWHGSWHEWAIPLSCRGFVVLLPNPRGSLGYGSGFSRANFNDWGGGDFEDIMAGADFLVDRGYADPGRLGICGWSYGGYMASWAVTHSNRFKAAVVGAGVTNLFSFHGTTDISPDFLKQYFSGVAYEKQETYRDHSAINYVAGAVTPTLILHGEEDARVPVGQAYQLYRGLQQSGVETKLVVYPREGHGFREIYHKKDLLNRLTKWFEDYLVE